MKQFATAHCHPSSFDTASTPAAFVAREVELGSGAITCTDHGTLAGVHQVYTLGKKSGLIPVVGLEAFLRDDNCPILKKLGIEKTNTVPHGINRDEWFTRYPLGTYQEYCKYFHITMHFQDFQAYCTAVRLLSKADERAEKHGSERKPLFDWAAVEELAAQNVTATSSCLIGVVQRHLLDHNSPEGAKAYFQRMHHLFGKRFYVEVFPHVCSHNFMKKVFVTVGHPEKQEVIRFNFEKKLKTDAGEISAEGLADSFEEGAGKHNQLLEVSHYKKWTPYETPHNILAVKKQEGFIQNECRPFAPDGDVQWGCNRFVMGLARKYNVPILIGDDSHFAHPDEKVVQDIRLSQSGGSFKFYGSYHRQSSEEAYAYFKSRHGISEAEFEKWIDNSQEWASSFKGFKFETKPELPTKFFPSDSLAHTRRLIDRHGRLPKDRKYYDRLKAELDMLHRNGSIDLLPYFHIDEEVCRLYANQGWLTGPGRGSAAGLLLSYLLGITHVDPLKYGLSMERFLTDTRIKSGKMPDIDQDLPDRDPLVGWHVPVIEFEAADGTKHVVPETMRFETDLGPLTIAEALERGAELEPWWKARLESQSNSPQQ